jgi:hypothetical protein
VFGGTFKVSGKQNLLIACVFFNLVWLLSKRVMPSE